MSEEVAVRRQKTIDAILDGVDRLLARYGYQKMTMDDLAREAGISKRTIYLHFTNKEHVALASIDRVVERLLRDLAALAHGNGSPQEKLRQMLMTRVLFRFDSVQEYYESFDELFAALRPAYLARREQYFAQEAELFAEVLREGEKAGTFATGHVMQTAQALVLATNSLLPYSLSAKELGNRAQIQRKVANLVDVLLKGVLRRKEDLL